MTGSVVQEFATARASPVASYERSKHSPPKEAAIVEAARRVIGQVVIVAQNYRSGRVRPVVTVRRGTVKEETGGKKRKEDGGRK